MEFFSEMPKNKTSYRIFAVWFLLLMLVAPVAKSSNYATLLAQSKETVRVELEQGDLDSSSETTQSNQNECEIHEASDFKAVVTVGIQLNFNVVGFLPTPKETFVSLNETKEEIFIPSSSQHHKTMHTHYISPQAP